MNERLPPPLDRRLLEWLRAERPAPPDARARVRARLEAAIPSMRPGGGGGPSGGAGGGGAISLAPHLLAVGAFVAGAVAGASLYAAWTTPHAPQIVYVDRPVPEVSATRSAGPAAVPAASAVLAGSPIALPSRTQPKSASPAPGRARASAPTSVSQLSAERALLDDARGALVQGEQERALDRLDRHRREFPNGLLGEERDAMDVEALVRTRRYDEARARAAGFRKRWPASLFSSTVEAAMADGP